jgi:hypothetical protein
MPEQKKTNDDIKAKLDDESNAATELPPHRCRAVGSDACACTRTSIRTSRYLQCKHVIHMTNVEKSGCKVRGEIRNVLREQILNFGL